MGKTTKQLRHRFFPIATACASACLAVGAGADAISPATAAAGATPGIAYAASFGGNSALAAPLFVFVGGVLLVTLACFGWLVYLMLAAPAGAGPDRAATGAGPASAEPVRSVGQVLAHSIRVRLGSLLGHAGPV